MKPEEVILKEEHSPEEDLIYKNNRELFYSFNSEQNCYTRKVDYQYQANQVIIKQGWDVLEDRLDDLKNRVIKGELSPLAYFMEEKQMDVPMLAGYAGVRKWKVRRHLRPKNFIKLPHEELKKYASALQVSVEQLVNPDFLIKK